MNRALLLFGVSVLPVILIGIYIYNKDRNKEPFKLLFKLFIGGVASIFAVLIISMILKSLFPIFSEENITNLDYVTMALKMFIYVALVEESCKWGVAYFVSFKDKEFDEFYDAIIYCVFVSLGFACLENMLYIFSQGLFTALLRALISVPGHAVCGIYMGYFFGRAKIEDIRGSRFGRFKYLFLSVLVPILIHGTYDYLLSIDNIAFLIVFFILLIVSYILAIKKINKTSKDNFNLIR